jgi:hypothetical protein
MKGEQQEERIPNFIGNAVIILTAAHLGCEVEMLATAQEVWRTKRLPEAVLLGMYEKAACDAVSAVRKRGLAEQADRLGEIFYRTGEFPPPAPPALSKSGVRSCSGDSTSSKCHKGFLIQKAKNKENCKNNN